MGPSQLGERGSHVSRRDGVPRGVAEARRPPVQLLVPLRHESRSITIWCRNGSMSVARTPAGRRVERNAA